MNLILKEHVFLCNSVVFTDHHVTQESQPTMIIAGLIFCNRGWYGKKLILGKWICSISSRFVSDLLDLIDIGSRVTDGRKSKENHNQVEENIGKETQTRE
jgi:hypothetical protein